MSKSDSFALGTNLLRAPAPARAVRTSAPNADVEFAQLYFALQNAVRTSDSRIIQFTGASSSVGTSFVLRQVAEVAKRVGGLVEISDLSALDLADPNLFPVGQRDRSLEPLGGTSVGRDQGDPRSGLRLIDSPPVATSAASLGLAGRVDGTILVVEAERTTRALIDESLARIQQCGGRCLGLVFNRRTFSLSRNRHSQVPAFSGSGA